MAALFRDLVLLLDLFLSFLLSVLSRLACLTYLLAASFRCWNDFSDVRLEIQRPHFRKPYVYYTKKTSMSLNIELIMFTSFPTSMGRIRASISPLQDATGGRLGHS